MVSIRFLDVAFVLSVVLICCFISDYKDLNRDSLPWLLPGDRPQLGAEYDTIAQSIRRGEGYSNPFPVQSGPTAWMPPVLTYIIAGLYWVTGDHRPTVVEIMVLIQASVVFFVGLVFLQEARRLGAIGVGYVLFGLQIMADFHELFQRTGDYWLVLLALSLTWLILNRFRERIDRDARGMAWGIFGGFSALCSPIAGFTWGMMTLSVMGVRNLLRWRTGDREAWGRLRICAFAILVSGLVVLPWSVRNRVMLGKWIPIKPNLAYEVWQSQCLDDDGVLDSKSAWIGPWGFDGDQRARYLEVGEVEFVQENWPPVLISIRRDPLELLNRIANRSIAATLYYMPMVSDYELLSIPMAYKRCVFPLPFVAVFCILSFARRPIDRPIAMALGIYFFYLAPYFAISYYDRYAAPLFLIKLLLMLYGSHLMWKVIRRRNNKELSQQPTKSVVEGQPELAPVALPMIARRSNVPRATLISILWVTSSFAVASSIGWGAEKTGDGPAIRRLVEPALSARIYEPWEIRFSVDVALKNPYDPDEIDVSLTFEGPDKIVKTHPGFYQVPYKYVLEHGKELPRADGKPFWAVRIAPMQIGEHRWKLHVRHRGKESTEEGSFECQAGERHGFVRVSVSDPRFFEYSDGTFFYPIGHVIRSPSDRRWLGNSKEHLPLIQQSEDQGIFTYQTRFRNMAANGENFCIIWMAPWWCGLEWSPTLEGYEGIGRYNQLNAARLDLIVRWAEQEGICLLLFLSNHGQLSSYIDAEWHDSPYRNTQSGGMLQYASDMFVNEDALRGQRNLLRYISARWGSSSSIAIMGLCTETDWLEAWLGRRCLLKRRPESIDGNASAPETVPTNRPSVVDWLTRSTQYLHQTDAHPHIVTTQFALGHSWNDVAHLTSMESILCNGYTWKLAGNEWSKPYIRSSPGVIDGMYAFDQHFGNLAPEKPRLVAEWGGSPFRNSDNLLATEMHAGLWAMCMTNISGATGFWWWHMLENEHVLGEFQSIRRFVDGFDRRGRHMRSTRAVLLTDFGAGIEAASERFATHARQEGLVLNDVRSLFAYVYSPEINAGSQSIRPNGFDDPRFVMCRSCLLQVPEGMEPGTYRIEFWNTFDGTVIEQRELEIEPDRVARIELIPHRVDLALKMHRIEKQ